MDRNQIIDEGVKLLDAGTPMVDLAEELAQKFNLTLIKAREIAQIAVLKQAFKQDKSSVL